MRRLMVVLLAFFLYAFGGCSDTRARELYETAQFEELQNNRSHATQLYRELIEKYPETEYGKKAGERLEAMK
jgi:hypothetical protein